MSNKVIYAIYNDDDTLMDAVKKTRAAHHHIEEVFTPFPVHGLDKAMGIAPTRLAICAFIYGLCGLSFGTWMPAFVPIMFEETVFFAAHLMVITFYMRSRLWPFKQAENPDVRTTDDHFLMEVAVNNNEKELVSFFENTGAVEVKVIEKH